MNGIDKLADVLVNSIKKPDNKPKPKPYDTPAEVRRVEGDTAFVHIPGGVDETPVKLTINAKAGDSVQVRISGGRAFLVGNASSPPTDDSTAIYVQKQVLELNNSFIENSNIVNAEIVNLKARDSELDQAIVIQSNIVKSEIYNSQIEDFTVINGVVQGLKATDAEISGKITAAEADIGNLKANKADISELEANYAHITNGVIDNAKIGYADVNDLNAHYANIDLANVNNAWIQNGVIKDAAITDAQIIGVGANKITAGVIDASKITVTNLNADNITAGTINGQRIGTGSLSLDKLAEEVPTKEYLDDLADNLQGQIDGQIETWTGTTVPTLNNAPAVDWKGDAKKLKAHVGDIYYVVNAANDADGYTYRFTESGSGSSATYSWTLIKDNQITKALQEIQEAKGDISGIKQFDSEISSWKTDTDEELSSLKGRTTTLETDMGTKVSTQTFNELSQTVDENTASISSLSETVDTKADGSTVQTLSNTVNTVKQTADTNKSSITNLTKKVDDNETDIEQKYSDLTQDLSGFKTTVGSTYHKISDFNTYKTANDAAVAAAKKAGDDAQADLDDYKETVKTTYVKNSTFETTTEQIRGEVSAVETTTKSYTDGKISQEVTDRNSAINQKADAITASVSSTYATKDSLESAKSEIKATTDGISTEVAKKTDKASIISTIRQSAESVKIKASQVEIDGTATFNAIKASADAAYDAKGAADAVQIGGRNLLIGTPNFHLINGSVLDTKTNFMLYVWTTPGKTYSGYKTIMPSKVYSSPGHITETFVAQNDSLSYFCIKHNGTKNDYSVFFDAPTEAVKSGETYTLSFDIIGANPSVENGLDIKNFKLERGNRATDWTPAPEDVDDAIGAKKSTHTLSTTYSYTYAQLLTYSNEYTTDWTVSSTTDVSVGDTVRLKMTVSDMNNAPVYIVGTVTSVNSATRLTMTSHGLDTTVIDGGNILTNSITANQIKGNTLTLGNMSAATQEQLLHSDNMLADTDAPSLTKVYGGSDRYWSDTANTSITPSIVTLSDPPEPNLKYTARFVCNGTNETDDKGQRALTFYSAANTTDIPLKLGMKYTASWWGRATSGTGTMKTFLWFRATSDSGNMAGNHKFDLTSKWKLYTVTFELGTETSYNRLWFYAQFGAKTSGTIELCGFKLVPGENASTTGNAGGTNLLRNSQTMPIQAIGTPGWRASGGVISKPSPAITNPPRPEFKGAIRVTNTSSSTSVIGIAQDYVDGKFIAGETYTMSFWARASEAATRVLYCQPIWISGTNNTGTSNSSLGYGVSWDVSTEWRYYKFEGAVLGGSQQSRYSAGYVYRNNTPANGWIEVCGMKLERGNKATDWTPAPEDVQADIKTAEANAKKEATNYIHAGSDGIKIANADPEHADTYQKQTSNSTEFYVDGVKRSDISGNGMRVYDNDGVESASFGRVPIIGKSEKNHLQLDDDSVDFMDGDTLIGYVGSDSARFPVMHVQSRMSIGDKYELRVTPSGSFGLYLM